MYTDKYGNKVHEEHDVSYSYDVVRAELVRRGVDVSGTLPNKTVVFPANLELLYLQESPKLAAWVRYKTVHDMQAAFDNLTSKRCGPDTTIQLTIGDIVTRIADGNHRGGGL